MKVGISQPRYFPWMPYIQRMRVCDLWVFLDDIQFNKRSFEHRCKVGMDAKTYLTVPVSTSQRSNISEVLISPDIDWRNRHRDLISDRNRGAKHLDEALLFFDYCVSYGRDDLFGLIDQVTRKCQGAFGYTTKVEYQSQLGITTSASQLLLDICKAVGATEYVSGQGGRNYMDMSLFEAADMPVSFFEWPVTGESCIGTLAREGVHGY